jgi:hypothetical protein
MLHFRGLTSDGCRVVVYYTHGQAEQVLPLRLDLRYHSPSGHNWGYGGSGAAQTALAILAAVLGDNWALLLYQDYKWEVVARLKHDGWTLTSADVLTWFQGIPKEERDEMTYGPPF